MEQINTSQAANQQGQQPAEDPQHEEIYKRLGLSAMKLIYTKPESDHILEIVRAGKDNPADAVAKATFAVVKRLQNEINGVHPNFAYSVAPAVIALIFELAESAGIFDEETLPEGTDPNRMIAESLKILAQMAKEPQQQQLQQQAMGA